MDPILSAEVAQLVHFGWHIHSQTQTTAALDTRSPFNWLIFAIALFFFFGFGSLLYVGFWLIASRSHLFLHIQDGKVVTSGDTWLVEHQKADETRARQVAIELKQRGFWSVMWPSIVATVAVVLIWIAVLHYVTSH